MKETLKVIVPRELSVYLRLCRPVLDLSKLSFEMMKLDSHQHRLFKVVPLTLLLDVADLQFDPLYEIGNYHLEGKDVDVGLHLGFQL